MKFSIKPAVAFAAVVALLAPLAVASPVQAATSCRVLRPMQAAQSTGFSLSLRGALRSGDVVRYTVNWRSGRRVLGRTISGAQPVQWARPPIRNAARVRAWIDPRVGATLTCGEWRQM